LFHIPLIYGVILTSFGVLLILLLQNRGFRYIEALIISLISIIAVCFGFEMFLSRPELGGVLHGLVPSSQIMTNPEMLYIALGILGATVMPHNLYLHSSIVQTRKFEETVPGKKMALKFATIDSTLALSFAFFVNAAILILSAAAFHTSGHTEVASIEDAYQLLGPLLGTGAASILFGVALLASGQSSTLTGTLAGQIVMEGFINIRLKPWFRGLITRLIALLPAVIVIAIYGERGTVNLLILSQVILSLQLSFAVVPLVKFTGDRKKMGELVSPRWLRCLAWFVASIIVLLNAYLLFATFTADM
jgi:manganese transport protein